MFSLMKSIVWNCIGLILVVALVEGQVQIGCTDAKFGSFALDPSDTSCRSFLWCLNKPLPQKCPGSLKFDPRFNVCNWDFLTPCVFNQPDVSQSPTVETGTTTKPLTRLPSTTTLPPPPVTSDRTLKSTTTTTTTTATSATTSTTTATRTSTTTTTNPPTNPDADLCSLSGARAFYEDKTDCSFYIMCDHGRSLRQACPLGLVWNQQGWYCDWPSNVNCDRQEPPENNDSQNSGTSTVRPVENNDPDDNPSDTTDAPNNGNQETTDETPANVTYSPPIGNSSSAGDCQRIVCYFTNWAQYRPAGGKFVPENMDATHCTHIIYAFAKLNGNRLAAYEWNDDTTPYMTGMYARVMKLKITNPGLKVLLAVGGWNLGSGPFTQMVATQSSRQEFIDTSIQFLKERNFDGVDLDWEYPANRGSPSGDRNRFSLLLKETREAFENEARATNTPRLLLAAAVSAGKTTIDSAYEIPELAKYLDFANLMSYDLHGAWDSVVGHNSPLYPGPWEFGAQRYLNVDWAARYWVQSGFPKENLVVGVPFYGRTFTLAGTSSQIRAPARGAGSAGTYTRERGFVSYYETCEYLQDPNTVSRRLEPMRVPYLVKNGKEWIGYDDSQSLTTKVEYIVQNSYGGVMIWSIAMDDFQGQFCGQGRYPLMNAVRKGCGLGA